MLLITGNGRVGGQIYLGSCCYRSLLINKIFHHSIMSISCCTVKGCQAILWSEKCIQEKFIFLWVSLIPKHQQYFWNLQQESLLLHLKQFNWGFYSFDNNYRYIPETKQGRIVPSRLFRKIKFKYPDEKCKSLLQLSKGKLSVVLIFLFIYYYWW